MQMMYSADNENTEDNDIPVVVPAGHDARASAPIGVNAVPALWGIASASYRPAISFPLIVAGAVTNQGLFAPFSQGRLDYHQLVWGPGEGVRCAGKDGSGESMVGTGTSFSAGMVSTLGFLLTVSAGRFADGGS